MLIQAEQKYLTGKITIKNKVFAFQRLCFRQWQVNDKYLQNMFGLNIKHPAFLEGSVPDTGR